MSYRRTPVRWSRCAVRCAMSTKGLSCRRTGRGRPGRCGSVRRRPTVGPLSSRRSASHPASSKAWRALLSTHLKPSWRPVRSSLLTRPIRAGHRSCTSQQHSWSTSGGSSAMPRSSRASLVSLRHGHPPRDTHAQDGRSPQSQRKRRDAARRNAKIWIRLSQEIAETNPEITQIPEHVAFAGMAAAVALINAVAPNGADAIRALEAPLTDVWARLFRTP
jgi:hypothetical protein